jgi:NAD(P)-dependent dehydrogenase (short-subunit alcohol dehydrogenase family)
MMPAGKLTGKVAWIGGGASGIGEATVELFAAEGASVCIVDQQVDRGNQAAERILSRGGQSLFCAADVADESQVQSSIAKAVEKWDGLNIVVNCAGIVHAKMLHEYSSAEWDQLMAVNVKSIFFAFKHAWPYLSRQSRSYVINVGSISSFIAQAATPAYTASKGAVLQLSRSIAVDYAEYGLRCNCVCPGITDTPMLRHHLNATPDPEAALRRRLNRVPTGTAMQPEQIAKSILFLSCEDSAGITGTSLLVDGGYLAAAEWQCPAHTAFME